MPDVSKLSSFAHLLYLPVIFKDFLLQARRGAKNNLTRVPTVFASVLEFKLKTSFLLGIPTDQL